jgi:hypothetical protein
MFNRSKCKAMPISNLQLDLYSIQRSFSVNVVPSLNRAFVYYINRMLMWLPFESRMSTK